MKKIVVFILLVLAASVLAAACGRQWSSPVTPVPPTATPTPVTVGGTVSYGGSFNFSPSVVSITQGQAVVWDSTLTGHTVTLDNFSGTSGICAPTNFTAFPVTQVFSAPGTFYYHCSYHSGCAVTQCGVCTGGLSMIGNIVVN